MQDFMAYSTENKSIRFPYSPSDYAIRNLLYCDLSGIIYAMPDYIVNRIALDTVLICYIINGKGELKYKNKTIQLKSGSLFILDCNNQHTYSTNPQSPLELIFIHVNGKALKPYMKNIEDKEKYHFTLEHNSKITSSMFKIIYMLRHHLQFLEEYCSLYIHTILTELMILSKTQLTKQYKSQQKFQYIEQIKTYIEINFNTKITLDLLSKEFAISKSHIQRTLKDYAHQTLYEYVLRCRLKNAKNFMLNTNLTINEIAHKVGFNDHSNLTRYFKKHEHLTPREFRKTFK